MTVRGDAINNRILPRVVIVTALLRVECLPHSGGMGERLGHHVTT